MFVALELLQQNDEGIIQKLKGILSRPKTWLDAREYCGAQYVVVTAQIGPRSPDWAEIQSIAAEHSRWILLPEGVSAPPGTTLRTYDPCEFDRKVLLHTACEIIARTRMPMYRRVVGLIDDDGSHADLLPSLLKHCTTIKVVTRNLTRYRFASEQMMQEFGAPVFVSGQLSSLADCVLAIAPGDYQSKEDFRLPCPLLSGGECILRHRCECFSDLQSLPPPSETDKPPLGISPHLFAGALNELCGLENMDFVARSFRYNHKVSYLQEAVRTVLFMAGIPPA